MMGGGMGGGDGATTSALALFGQLGEMTGQFVANRENRDAQRRAWKYQVLAMQNRYQWMMQDMEKAGLNPILAARGGLGGSTPSGPGMSPAMNPARGLGASARELAKIGSEVGILKNQKEQSYHAVQTEAQRSADFMASAQLKKSQRRLTEEQRVGQEIQNYLARTQMPSAKAVEDFYKTDSGTFARKLGLWMQNVFGNAPIKKR